MDCYQEEFQGKTLAHLEPGEYEECVFRNCDLSESALRGFTFLNCDFDGCNLSNAELADCSFQECHFSACKLVGLQFHEAKAFGFEIQCEKCNLDHCVFYQMDISRCTFSGCSLVEADFSEANAQGVDFSGSELQGAVFDQTNLEKADLRFAKQYSINPEANSLSGCSFSSPEVLSLLDKYGLVIEQA